MDFPNKRVFIASPLFNPVQIDLIKSIEELLAKYSYRFYSARLHGPDIEGRPSTKEQRQEIFQSNIDGLKSCSIGIVILDYLLPDTEYVSRNYFEGEQIKSQILHLPDSGTVFELGWMYARRACSEYDCIVVFSAQGKPNLMLSESSDHWVHDLIQLETIIKLDFPTECQGE